MKCNNCQFESPKGMSFCGNCGQALSPICPQCTFQNPPGFKFCGSCGSTLAVGKTNDDSVSQSTRSPKGSRPTAERRHLTVMFCDLVGSTALSNQLDPEDLRSLVAQYQEVCEKVVIRYEGHIAQYLGDGIMVYFGYPVAHENDAHRSASSALGILEAVHQLNDRLEKSHGIRISVRIGIHTGHVVVSEMGSSEQSQQLAMGATPNIAARLEGLAAPNTAIVSTATHELIHRYFQMEPKGKHQLKGLEDDMDIYQVVSENTALVRFEQNEKIDDQIPLAGREQEFERLLSSWQKAKDGGTGIVLLSGEAGVGKSRLLQTLLQQVASEPDAWLSMHHCSPYHKLTSYYPIAQSLKYIALQYKSEETNIERIARLEGFLVQYGLELEETVPLMASMLSIGLEGTIYKTTPFSAEQQRQKIIGTIMTFYLERCRQQNLLLVFEDLQWMDQGTLDIINQVINQSPTLNLLMVLTYRNEFVPPWRLQRHMVPIQLDHLRQEAIREMISNVAEGRHLPKELVELIIGKTDGVPLFVEELTKMVLGSDIVKLSGSEFVLTKPLDRLSIPSTLHDSLIARLDRMSHTKEIAQLGAVIGREFSFEIIDIVSDMETKAVRICLSQLVEAELLLQQGIPPNSTYRFRHALIQDAAYQSLLKSQRQAFHLLIAESIRDKLPEAAAQKPEMLAHHFELAGKTQKAIHQHIKAGQRYKNLQAFEQALVYCQKARHLLSALKQDEDRAAQWLELTRLEGPLFMILEGFTSDSVYRSYSQMYEMGQLLQDENARFQGLRGVTTYELFTGKPGTALQKAKRALVIAKSLNDIELIIEGYRLIGQTSIYTGEYRQSLQSFDTAMNLLSEGEKELIGRFKGFDLEANCLTQSCHVAWYLGYPEQALQRAGAARERANRIGQPFSQAMSHFLGCLVHFYCGQDEEAFQLARIGTAVSEEYGLAMLENELSVMIGLSLLADGHMEEGTDILQKLLEWRNKNKQITASFLHISVQLDGYMKSGLIKEAQGLIISAEDLLLTCEDRLGFSEILRLKAELLLQTEGQSGTEEAMNLLDQSQDIAVKQQAKSYELRTVMSKARILERTGRIEDAYHILTKIYSWFTEGFQTKDLMQAKQHLDALRPVIKESN